MLRPFSLQFNSRESWWHSWTVWGMNVWPISHVWGSHGQPNRQRGSVLFFDLDCSIRAIDPQEGNRTGLCVLPALLQQHVVLQWNGRIWSEREARRPALTNYIHFSTSMCISDWSWACIFWGQGMVLHWLFQYSLGPTALGRFLLLQDDSET